jgi:hypothetical protein
MTRIFVDYRKAKAGPPPSAKDDNQKAKAREQSSRAKQQSKAAEQSKRAKQEQSSRAKQEPTVLLRFRTMAAFG